MNAPSSRSFFDVHAPGWALPLLVHEREEIVRVLRVQFSMQRVVHESSAETKPRSTVALPDLQPKSQRTLAR